MVGSDPKKMFAVISRNNQAGQTPGCFIVFDKDRVVVNVKCLELPFLENAQEISCIPEGVYDCVRIHHKKFGVCFLVENVPGREGILIHIGNYASGKKKDTRGCILPGLRFVDLNKDGNLDVANSTEAMNLLRSILPAKFKIHIFDNYDAVA